MLQWFQGSVVKPTLAVAFIVSNARVEEVLMCWCTPEKRTPVCDNCKWEHHADPTPRPSHYKRPPVVTNNLRFKTTAERIEKMAQTFELGGFPMLCLDTCPTIDDCLYYGCRKTKPHPTFQAPDADPA